MDNMLPGIKDVFAYLRDVIIVGRTEEEHRNDLDAKCLLFLPGINYLGFVVERNGRSPDLDQISAIKRVPGPSDQPPFRSFLGLVNYYGAFVLGLSELRAPLNARLRKTGRWKWLAECQQAIDHVKEIPESDLLLTHYDPTKEITVTADTSIYGVGAVIMHRFADGTEKAICHASGTLTNAEQKYSQIEKEALALVFAVKTFHRVIHGRKFTLLTDHKPLGAVFGSKKETSGQPDAFSGIVGKHTPAEEGVVIAAINAEHDVRRCLSDSIHAFPVTSELVSRETAEDTILAEVLKCITGNWAKPPVSKQLQPFFNRRNALSVVEGCIMMIGCVVKPRKLQPASLKQLHQGHPGIVRMKAIAPSYI
ncbi:hypothetical protein TTRE_0000981501 [Trichuris trichiura]|uniref:RNA-directed DNA polymerase n=1 Tax=Trichuris trichiura TaxID=36087 RepID=A0A077ZLY9_TRITR|nr:hypothetical protein TTRE_0000981501 [Trichuris trichiura]